VINQPGKVDAQARARDAQTRKWDVMKHALLALDVSERPALKEGVDVSRQDAEAMPGDVRAVVFGYLNPDSRLDGMM
jgi:hypothetical protein